MLLPSLLFTALLCCVQAERTLTADTVAFVAKFRELNETTDPLASLERIGEDSRELFRLGRPVGQLLSTFNSTGQATEDETKALAELHKLFDHFYTQPSNASTPDHMFTDFGLLLENMRSYMAPLTNGTHRSEGGGVSNVEFVKSMRLHRVHTGLGYNPMAVLDMIDSISRLGCKMPTKEGIVMVGRLQDALWRAETNARGTWNETELYNLDRVKKGLFYLISSKKAEGVEEKLIKCIDDLSSPSFEFVMATLRNGHAEISMNQTSKFTVFTCLMEYTTDVSAFNQTSLLLRLHSIHKDFIRILILEWSMSSFIELEDEYYYKDAEIATLTIERTAHFLARWTRTVQNVSWPEIGIEFAKRAMALSPIPLDAYNQTAKRIQKAFEEHGSPSYAYQVLVLPTSEVDVSWSVGSTRTEDYTNITNFNGLDVHVFRFNKTENYGRADEAYHWMRKNEKGIVKEIRNGALAKTSTVLSYLQTESSIAPIYSDDLYRSVILLKKIKSSPVTNMPFGMARSGSLDNYHKLEITRTSYSVLEHGKETTYLGMLLPTLLVSTLLCRANAKRNLTQDVQSFISKFREMNETTDVLGSLDRMAVDSREFFKLGLPAGKLLVTYNATGKVTEEETRALAELHKLFNNKYELPALNHHNYHDYQHEFGMLLEPLRMYVATVTNVTTRHSSGHLLQALKMQRKHRHYMGTDPLSILEMIDSTSRLGCRTPTKQGITTLIRLQEALRRIENIARASWEEGEYEMLDSYKQGVFYLITEPGAEEHADKLIRNLNEANITDPETVMQLLHSGYSEMQTNISSSIVEPTMCMLEATLDDSRFNLTYVYSKLKKLHRDLMRIQLLEWAIGSIAEQEDEYYNRDAEITVLMIDRTAHFLAKWTRTVQNISWPEIGIEFAKRSLELSQIPSDAYDIAARKVQKAFEEHCSESYAYQVVVVPTSEMDVSWSVGSKNSEDKENYANITNFNGLDIHVFRYNKTGMTERSVKAKKWMEKNKDELKKELRNRALAKPSTVLSCLQTESSIGPIYSEDLFRSIILLKKVRHSSAKTDMPIGLAIYWNSTSMLEVTRTSYSVLEHGKETIYAWKALFFL